MNSYKRVEDLYAKVSSLGSISGILNWDESTFMPKGSMKLDLRTWWYLVSCLIRL